ncbi:hypothetical protein B0H16DRAFT_1776666 [Mycena metata]|uniref:F-box domain-containing protein n=1 Tax=Mycena metata TaxID=1033252 RepID=A0AAD7NP21_9AGAR|nr:hypothetical protein B0H16DRAFT_1776666 [Mycena metata]
MVFDKETDTKITFELNTHSSSTSPSPLSRPILAATVPNVLSGENTESKISDSPADLTNYTVSHLIFALLHPKDLLQLSQATFHLCAFLWSRDRFVHIWKGVFATVDPIGRPNACPPDLPYPAYARLWYTQACQGCGCACDYTEWELRVRMCSECLKKEIVKFDDDSPPEVLGGVTIHDVVRCRPSTYGATYLKKDLGWVSASNPPLRPVSFANVGEARIERVLTGQIDNLKKSSQGCGDQVSRLHQAGVPRLRQAIRIQGRDITELANIGSKSSSKQR